VVLEIGLHYKGAIRIDEVIRFAILDDENAVSAAAMCGLDHKLRNIPDELCEV
jgi:hypothetical protein